MSLDLGRKFVRPQHIVRAVRVDAGFITLAETGDSIDVFGKTYTVTAGIGFVVLEHDGGMIQASLGEWLVQGAGTVGLELWSDEMIDSYLEPIMDMTNVGDLLFTDADTLTLFVEAFNSVARKTDKITFAYRGAGSVLLESNTEKGTFDLTADNEWLSGTKEYDDLHDGMVNFVLAILSARSGDADN